MHIAIGGTTFRALWQDIEQALGSISQSFNFFLASFHLFTIVKYLGYAYKIIEELSLGGNPCPLRNKMSTFF